MISSEPPIRRVTIEAFRGFRDRQEFDLSAWAVIVAGPNGTGKTSMFDAIQWALLGKIERLEGHRARRNVEHIVNQYRLGDRATVELELSIRGQRLLLRRSGDHRESTLEYTESGRESLFGNEAEQALNSVLAPHEGITLDMALTTSGLLQQDVMRAVLEAKPAERYRHISTVLGLSDLEDFEDAAKSAAKDAADLAEVARTERESAAVALEGARQQQQRLEDQELVLAPVEIALAELREMVERAPPFLAIDIQDPPRTAPEAAALAREAGRLQERMRQLRDERDAFESDRENLTPEPHESEERAREQAVRKAEESLLEAGQAKRQISAALEAAERATEEVARLAAAAIPLLSTSCPVCGQTIDPAEVERELRTRAETSENLLRLRQSLDESVTKESVAKAAHEAALAELDSIRSSRRAWANLSERGRQLDQELATLVADGGPVRVRTVQSSQQGLDEDATTNYLAGLRRALLELADVLQRGPAKGELQRSAAQVRNFEEALNSRNGRLEEIAQRATSFKSLADASVDARVEVTQERFAAVQPLVADIYSRLDPHPAFKSIEFELDTYYRRGTTSPLVKDVVEDILADPLVIFSTSQANIAALSYFLAMGWTAGERSLPFVLLDDPLQSMDDVNVLGFSDLCRHIRSNRQLVISTHEKRFADLLRRKLASRGEATTALVLNFVAWDRSGPSVERTLIEPQLVEQPIRLVRS